MRYPREFIFRHKSRTLVDTAGINYSHPTLSLFLLPNESRFRIMMVVVWKQLIYSTLIRTKWGKNQNYSTRSHRVEPLRLSYRSIVIENQVVITMYLYIQSRSIEWLLLLYVVAIVRWTNLWRGGLLSVFSQVREGEVENKVLSWWTRELHGKDRVSRIERQAVQIAKYIERAVCDMRDIHVLFQHYVITSREDRSSSLAISLINSLVVKDLVALNNMYSFRQ